MSCKKSKIRTAVLRTATLIPCPSIAVMKTRSQDRIEEIDFSQHLSLVAKELLKIDAPNTCNCAPPTQRAKGWLFPTFLTVEYSCRFVSDEHISLKTLHSYHSPQSCVYHLNQGRYSLDRQLSSCHD